MNKSCIWVVDPATHTPEVDCYNKISEIAKENCSYHLPAIIDFDSMGASRIQPKGIVLLGSSANVGDGFEWQSQLDDWLHEKIEQQIPVFGICYGHQTIAAMFGSSIKKNPVKNKGFRNIEVLKDERLGIAKKTVPFICSHFEEVEKAPEGFEVWATSPEVDIDGLRHSKNPIWTLQSHPEATSKFLKNAQIDLKQKDQLDDLLHGYHIIEKFLSIC